MNEDNNKPVRKGGFFDTSDYPLSKNIRWIICLLFVIFAIINGWHVVSLLLLLAAVLVMPTRIPEYLLTRIQPMTAIIVVLALVLVGLIVEPAIYDAFADSSQSPSSDIPSGLGSNGTAGNNQNNNSSDTSGSTSGGNVDNDNSKEDNNDSSDSEEDDTSEGSSVDEENTTEENSTYVLNTISKKFHDPDCYHAERMNDENKEIYYGSREDLINNEYIPCGTCKP